jgi:3-hydroxybutyrate dehydrogenase
MKDKVVLVTGSTSGIGLGIASAFACEGATVMLHGLAAEAERSKLMQMFAPLAAGRAAISDADLSVPGAAERLIRETVARFGRIDILVNNAGIQFVSPIEEFPPERWSAINEVILGASFQTTRAAVPGMKARGWGRIVNLVSVHGLVASPFKSAYVAAKHGQIGLTKSVALELAATGVTCNAVCPGYVRTPLVDNQIASLATAHGLSPERVITELLLAAQPSGRFVDIEEIAALVLFLSSEEARSITGAAIPIDGGWTAR